jgi:hypothetical protein
MKKLVTIFFIVLISILVITSIVKLIKNLSLNYNDKNYQQMDKNFETNHSVPKWIKHDYFLPNGSWIIQNPNYPLIVGKKYFLIQTVLNEEKCFYGMFFLKKIQKNDLFFKTDKEYSTSRLKQYSRIKSIKITTIIFSEDDLSFLGKIQNCSEWVKIGNN